MCTDDSSDVDVLYQLAVDPENSSSDNFESSEESNSDASETEWPKQEINATDVDFDKTHVVPRYPFLYEDRPADFLYKYFDDELLSLIVEQIHMYAKQCKLRHWTETYRNEIKAFTRIRIGMGVHLVATVDHY